MKFRSLLGCVLLGILLYGACSKKEPPASSAESNNQQPAATTPSPQPPPETATAPSKPAPEPTTAATPKQEPHSSHLARKAAEQPTTNAVAKPAPPPAPVVVPTGTVITVRLAQPISSKTSHTGDRFEATLSEPLVVEGKTLAPTGATAGGAVTQAQSAGKFKGAASLNVVLDTLIIQGNRYQIHTAAVSQTSKGKGKRTATMVGGGTGAGALIGGIAGGGKGAAIGALVGGGAGTAGAAMTGNDNDINLPAEAALSFKLTAPVTLKPTQSNAQAQN